MLLQVLCQEFVITCPATLISPNKTLVIIANNINNIYLMHNVTLIDILIDIN